MPEGVIVGGWGFVIAAYVVTVVGLTGYGFALWRRLRATGCGVDRDVRKNGETG